MSGTIVLGFRNISIPADRGILLRMIQLTATVQGEVQGVFYRAYVQDAATELQIVGSVENKSDGTVVVVAEGMNDVLKEFVEHLHEGSLQAHVEGVSVEWGTACGTFSEFSVLQ